MRTGLCAAAWIVSFLLGCGQASTPGLAAPTENRLENRPVAENQPGPDDRFTSAANAFYTAYLDSAPDSAVELGYHQYDGKLPDVGAAALAARAAMYHRAGDTFTAIAPGDLSAEHQIEREVLLTAIRGRLFDLEVLDLAHRSPIVYVEAPSLMPYVARDYAPREQRARAIIALAGGLSRYIAQAEKNLQDSLPRTFLDVAILQARGMIEFARTDVPTAMAGVGEPLATDLGKALDTYCAAMQGFVDFLQGRMASATDDFALGPDRFLRMLRDKEGVDISLARLIELGEADLQRNLAAVKQATAAIAARGKTRAERSRSASQVFWRIKNEKPAADKVLAVASKQAEDMRRFLVDRNIVSIPSDEVAEVRVTPPFMRYNSAFLSAAGLFDREGLPSFYFISPPDPRWPVADQKAYIPWQGELLFTTIHEVWPGHFLHHLHEKKNPSRILATFCTYSYTEGWAHYSEEMMWQENAVGTDPVMHLGQLGDALLRNVRVKSAIALHTGGAKVAEVAAWFRDLAYQDNGNAMQQAVRGTFDPGYLNYTLGKLMILKLRDDWKARMGDAYSLQAFHDAFLSYGCAPIPLVRRAMLGDDSPAL